MNQPPQKTYAFFFFDQLANMVLKSHIENYVKSILS